MEIIYPKAYDPSHRPVFVRNEIETNLPPEKIWSRLVLAARWPEWYLNSSNVKLDSGGAVLGAHTKFTWKTFGFFVKSEIVEFVPNERIAWRAVAPGIDAYHAWLIVRTQNGCKIITEETQSGFICVLGKFLMPNRMSKWHQIWLEELAK